MIRLFHFPVFQPFLLPCPSTFAHCAKPPGVLPKLTRFHSCVCFVLLTKCLALKSFMVSVVPSVFDFKNYKEILVLQGVGLVGKILNMSCAW